MKAEIQAGEQVIEIDTTEMEERIIKGLDEKTKKLMEGYVKELRDNRETKKGKGVVESYFPDESKKVVVEEFQKGEHCNPQKIKEQWTIAIPYWATNELAGHLRDYVWVTDVVKGKPGETVYIPYVKDIDFEHAATPHTSGWAGKGDLINFLQTTLHESGTYYDAYYGDIEKIDANMLDELNRVFAHAAIRAEDIDLIHRLDEETTADMTSPGGTTRRTFGESTTGPVSGNGVILGNTLSGFAASWIAKGIAKLLKRGKDVRPGECILIIGPNQYADLIAELVGTTGTALGYGKSDVIKSGLIEDYLGVKVVVVHHPGHHAEPTGSTNSLECAYLIRPKRTLALAPKRDILIETDKLIKERQLRIAGSHTYGVALLDPTEICKFWTKHESSCL